MHRCGYVHRDISVTNVLKVGDAVKLADLEYVKKYSETDQHRVRTVSQVDLSTKQVDVTGPAVRQTCTLYR